MVGNTTQIISRKGGRTADVRFYWDDIFTNSEDTTCRSPSVFSKFMGLFILEGKN